MPMTEQEVKAIIHETAKESVHETLQALGFEVETPREVQADQLYLRKIRKGSQDVNIYVRRSAIWALICTGAYMAFLGLKSYLKNGGS